ncbi:hypothetical protein GOC87_32715 [Sinorhizobium meliloti]|uniref:hypothetical protein n=1 Tax=Rhizobium meliloti TaxID=382 RepID=UPI000B4A5113|nr:hypothetical protein [Sinorhizobium meliloti]ASP96727.1 hypothetical protein CDO24_04320 [Sinorhizobium meliloti]MDW9708241.1 hypothetical protein [Sinorhizobium meliloti]MDW9935361.1 hypothetical protein [Sinorhizobium meliloti]MDX0104357.1 hypothetical protein [Sinorhizobium meliloti]MDX0123018.1 hypothetical protein [Sinorhizobium meliloti]
MADNSNITALEILQQASEVTLTASTLAGIIDRHRAAFSRFNNHCTVLADQSDFAPADERVNRKLGKKERAARLEFLQYRPRTLAEVRAKVAYSSYPVQ